MLNMYRTYLNQYLDLEEVTDRELGIALEQLGRDLVYNYLVFGKDATFEIFLQNLSIYLKTTKRVPSIKKELLDIK